MSLGRRHFLLIAAGAGLHQSLSRASHNTISVKDFGARGDGGTVDSDAINKAFAYASKLPGTTVIFPKGKYWLGDGVSKNFLRLDGAERVSINGEGAQLRCKTTGGVNSILRVIRSRQVSISGLGFFDEGLKRPSKEGAVSIHLSGEEPQGCSDVHIWGCSFESVFSAVTARGMNGEVSGIKINDLSILDSYYGLNFQDCGNHVTARGVRCQNVRRSYFPYGVHDHYVELETSDNYTGFTDILIKCYAKPTRDIEVKAECFKKRGGDAVVAFDQQHERDLGVIERVKVALTLAEADCLLQSVFLLRAFEPAGRLRSSTNSVWKDIELSGAVQKCARTSLIKLESLPNNPAEVRFSRGLAPLVPGPVRGLRILQP